MTARPSLSRPNHGGAGRARAAAAGAARTGRGLFAEDLVIALKNQAHLDIDAGRYDVAERAAQEAVDVGAGRSALEHPETVAALLMRAYVYQYSREPDAALRAAERRTDCTRQVFRDSPKHPRTIEGRCSTVAPSVKPASWRERGRARAGRQRRGRGLRTLEPHGRVLLAAARRIPAGDRPRSTRRSRTAARRSTSSRHAHEARVVPIRGRHPSARRRAPRGSTGRRGAARPHARRRDVAANAAGRARGDALVPGRSRARPGASRADIARRRISSRPSCPRPGHRPVARRSRRSTRWASPSASPAMRPARSTHRSRRCRWIGPEPSADRDRMRALTESGLALLDLAQAQPGRGIARARADALPAFSAARGARPRRDPGRSRTRPARRRCAGPQRLV